MKKFHFPLERVRDWRGKQVSLEEAKLERLNGEKCGVDAQLAALAQERTANETAVLRVDSIDALELRALDEYRRFARFRQATLERERAEWDRQIAEQRANIMEAQRKVRLLDKLRERKHKLWEAGFDKEIEEQGAEAFRARWSSSH